MRYQIQFKEWHRWENKKGEDGNNVCFDTEKQAVEYCSNKKSTFTNYRFILKSPK